MAKGKNQHVVKHPGGWAVKGEGNSKATKVTQTQAEAIQAAENIARNQKSDTKIHGVDGKIRAGNSYGNDQCPPKDKK
ncbi:DUF2188 domain-containing protein [candidate division KSB1 bacterium]|nr:DUF2188 domain-containing protein [candidate division KSB1 bacterium]